MSPDRSVAWTAAAATALAVLWVGVGPLFEVVPPYSEHVEPRTEAERTVRAMVLERLTRGSLDAPPHAKGYFGAALEDSRLLAPFAELVEHPGEKPESWDQVLDSGRYHYYLKAGPEGGRCQALFDRLVREQVDGEGAHLRRVQRAAWGVSALQVALVWSTLSATHRGLGARLACVGVLLLGALLAWTAAAGVVEARGGVETLLFWAPGEAGVLIYCLLFWRRATEGFWLFLAGAAVLGLSALGLWAYAVGSAY